MPNLAPLEVFQQAMIDISRKMLEGSVLANLLTTSGKLTQEDISRLQIKCAQDAQAGLYFHQEHERKFYLSNKLLSAYQTYWDNRKISKEMQLLMAKLFLIHELVHVPQSVSSSNYLFTNASSRSSAEIFATMDYKADADAIAACYMAANTTQSFNNNVLSEILLAQIHGGNVFAYIEDADQAKTDEEIEGSRMRRQLIWLYQYARAKNFPPEISFDDFHLERVLYFQVFPLKNDGYGKDLCEELIVKSDRLAPPLELKLLLGDIELESHQLNTNQQTNALSSALFEANPVSAIEVFTALFLRNPSLVGRGNSAQPMEVRGPVSKADLLAKELFAIHPVQEQGENYYFRKKCDALDKFVVRVHFILWSEYEINIINTDLTYDLTNAPGQQTVIFNNKKTEQVAFSYRAKNQTTLDAKQALDVVIIREFQNNLWASRDYGDVKIQFELSSAHWKGIKILVISGCLRSGGEVNDVRIDWLGIK
jgi:hypothetical protein